MPTFRRSAVLLVVLLPMVLSGCTLAPLGQHESDPRSTATAVADAPEGWAELKHCPGGPSGDWTWVDGFPVAELEKARITPACGDIWRDDGGDHFVGVAVFEATEVELDAFGAELIATGYEKLVDDFTPVSPGAAPAPVGARDYYLDGVHDGEFTRVAIEIYSNAADPMTYTAYIDYVSPGTRDLR